MSFPARSGRRTPQAVEIEVELLERREDLVEGREKGLHGCGEECGGVVREPAVR